MTTTREAEQVTTPTKNKGLAPHSLKDAPALIERLLPVQKLSVETYKENMAVHGKTLTALGSYWKGRKMLIFNKACILGSLLPATDDPVKDLEVFELLMGMDDEAMSARLKITPSQVAQRVPGLATNEYFECEPEGIAPPATPFDPTEYQDDRGRTLRIRWKDDLSEQERRDVAAKALPDAPYRDLVSDAKRPEELGDEFFEPIWDRVNAHLKTKAFSFPELVEQLGIARFGHRPVVADTFCGSGQIPFEAARLGCDVIASDLNPIACMLTWGAMHIVGGSPEDRERLVAEQEALAEKVRAFIDDLGVETAEFDGKLWRGKVYLYCVETRCPATGWMVPMLPTRQVSKGNMAIAELKPDARNKRYDIVIREGVSAREFTDAKEGTVLDEALVHTVDGVEHRTAIKTLRGDHRAEAGNNANRLRLWDVRDFKPHSDDIYQERLFAIQWQEDRVARGAYTFRSVTADDIAREREVEAFVAAHLEEWQSMGWLPGMRIEPGDETTRLYRERGWTHWHHLFNPRQLLLAGLLNRWSTAAAKPAVLQAINVNSRLSRWAFSGGGGGIVKGVYDNQALNTLLNYGTRGSQYANTFVRQDYKSFPLQTSASIVNTSAAEMSLRSDIFITDPPYGDAVKYEEILEFFIAWLCKSPPAEFESWVWDSRRSLAIKGEDDDFRQGMVAAYRSMTGRMPSNGLQIIMFTHQSTGIWADMANIVWASGLQVTAAWYVATETDSALRQGDNVKGTNVLVARKRAGEFKTTRDDLAWELEEEVKRQVEMLTGLNQQARGLYRDENLYEDADLQMAGYAAALRVLTQYATIDGKRMGEEACRPRAKGEKTAVDSLIDFAVEVANRCLIPQGISEGHWRELKPIERFYLKMLGMEASGVNKLDNYQNFAKAFKVSDFRSVMQSAKANSSRLKSAAEFKRNDMSEGSPLHNTPLRAIMYAMMELGKDVDTDDVLAHLAMNVPNYYAQGTRDLIVALCQYLGTVLESIRPDEASQARVLAQSVRNQRL